MSISNYHLNKRIKRITLNTPRMHQKSRNPELNFLGKIPGFDQGQDRKYST